MKIKPDKYLKQLNCLYVEDDASIRGPFLLMIQRYFKEVVVAKNGEEGLEKFHHFQPDIIISDVRMPVMDGIEMISRIKEKNSEVLIVFITAFSDVEYLKQAIDLGVDGYITKPIDKKKLILKLNKFAEFKKHDKEIKEYVLLLKEILDKQLDPIVLLERTTIKYTNKAFKNIFPSVENIEEFEKKFHIDPDCEKQIIEIVDDEGITLKYEVLLQKINNNFILMVLHDISQYEEEILLDQLTNVYNRKIITRLLPKLYGKTYCIAMLDIDNFKQVNDTYGHLVGDDVLRFIVDILKKSLRKDDIIIRFGGEEFLILFYGIKEKELAFKIANELRVKIAQKHLEKVGHVTCSFGIGCGQIDDEQSFEALIKRADEAMYKAKKSGKNKVVMDNAGERYE